MHTVPVYLHRTTQKYKLEIAKDTLHGELKEMEGKKSNGNLSHENGLIESFDMSPHFICMGDHLRLAIKIIEVISGV